MSTYRLGSILAGDDELVPLSVAATVAYFHINEKAPDRLAGKALAEALHLAAIALASIVPLHPLAADGSGAPSSPEITELLYRGLEEGKPPDLDSFAIRRGDLRKALAELREGKRMRPPG